MKSVSFYQKKLKDLDIFQTELKPEQFALYRPRIEAIRKNVQNQLKLVDNYTPFIGTFEPYILPKEDDEKEEKRKTKKDLAKDFYTTYNYAYMSNQGSNTKELDQSTIDKAKMTKASEFYHDDSLNKATMYLEDQGVPYYIDPELSDNVGVVLVRQSVNESGEIIPGSSAVPQDVKIAYRGTKWKNPNDVVMNMNVATNTAENTVQYLNAKNQLKNVISKYGDPSELVGFSKGSVLAIKLGEEFGYKTTNFNPLIGTGMLDKTASGNHRVIRINGDMPSFGISLKAQSDNFKIETMEPLADSLNPLTIHSIDNITESKPRQSEMVRQQKILSIKKTASKLSHAESLVKINNFRKNRDYNRRDFAEINPETESISFNHKVKSFIASATQKGMSKLKKLKKVGDLLRNKYDSPSESIREEAEPLLDFEEVNIQREPERIRSARLQSIFDEDDAEFASLIDRRDPSIAREVDETRVQSILDENSGDFNRRLQSIIDTEMVELNRTNQDLPEQFDNFFGTRKAGDRSYTDYIHSLDAGGTEILPDGSIRLTGDGFKNQRALWELSGGDFTRAEEEHFTNNPREGAFDTELTPADVRRINDGSIDTHNEFIDDLSLKNQEAFMQLHSSNQVPKVETITKGARIRSGVTNLGIGIVAQGVADKGIDIFDPQHKIQEDARQGLSGFLGGGLSEMGVLRLAGTAITAEAVAPVAVGAGFGAVAAYETDNWFRENAPDEVYLRDVSDGMVGMSVAGGITGTMLGGPLGGLIGFGIGAGVGFISGTGEYLYQKYI
jgi:hypothetical protein